MVQLSWGTVVSFATFVVIAGPGFYWLGRTSMKVDVNTDHIAVNTKDIRAIFSKIEDIHRFVKNGGSQPDG